MTWAAAVRLDAVVHSPRLYTFPADGRAGSGAVFGSPSRQFLSFDQSQTPKCPQPAKCSLADGSHGPYCTRDPLSNH